MLGRNLLTIAVCLLALGFVGFLVKRERLGKGDVQSLIGTWKLMDEETILSNGTAIQSGGSSGSIGILVYDDSGHFASQFFRPKTTTSATSSNLNTVRGANGSLEYEIYFGTYAVDSSKETVTCHVRTALPREDEGKDVEQQFSVVGKKLTTRSRISGPGGTSGTHSLVWTRLE